MNGFLTVTVDEFGYVMIGDAKVIVSKVKGNQVRLAIQAPKTTKILREKLVKRGEDARTKAKDSL